MEMNNEFNVLLEPWIPVTLCDGTVTECGIYQTLENASKIEKIRDDNPLEKVAIMRLLTAFLTDAYHLNSKRDRQQLYENHYFDMNIIKAYVDNCQKKYGASFNLFDSKRPFMVQAYDKAIDQEKTLKSAANLCLTIQSGNNPLHWRHTDESHFEGLTPGQALRSVLALYTFSPAMSGGYPQLLIIHHRFIICRLKIVCSAHCQCVSAASVN